ncbi:MAG: nucleotidyltransferase family protein [Bacillota bacterium]|nr:nucleotidyltransferase family protein [Bacillota bacterium]
MTKLDAVVLAGADNNGSLAACTDTPYEAMIDIQGRPMVEYVVDALRHSANVDRIVVVGPEHVLGPVLAGKVYRVVQSGRNIVENLIIGIEMLQPAGKILVVAADIPLLTTAAIDDFIERCREREADIYYPICRKEENEAKYPGMRRTYATLREGVFTGGNIFILNPAVVIKWRREIERAVAVRKSVLGMAKLLGFRLMVKFLLQSLSLREAEERVAKVLGCPVAAVETSYPEIGVDVDKPSDLELVTRHYRSRATSGKAVQG